MNNVDTILGIKEEIASLSQKIVRKVNIPGSESSFSAVQSNLSAQ